MSARAGRDVGDGSDGTGGGEASGFSRDSPEDRQLLVSLLLHAADLHNPLLPPPVSRRIAADLAREFEAQAALERAAGLPVTVMLADDRAGMAKIETGFSDFVVRPLYEVLAKVAPRLGAKCLPLIDANREAWAADLAAP